MFDKVYIVMEEYDDGTKSSFVKIKGVYFREELALEMIDTIKKKDPYEMKDYIKEQGKKFLKCG